jgi:hypothetical protein
VHETVVFNFTKWSTWSFAVLPIKVWTCRSFVWILNSVQLRPRNFVCYFTVNSKKLVQPKLYCHYDWHSKCLWQKFCQNFNVGLEIYKTCFTGSVNWMTTIDEIRWPWLYLDMTDQKIVTSAAFRLFCRLLAKWRKTFSWMRRDVFVYVPHFIKYFGKFPVLQ